MSKVDENTPKPLDKKGTRTLLAILTHPTRKGAYESLGISKEAFYKRVRKYNLNEHIDALPQEALSTLKQGSIYAAENFVNKIDSRNENISMEASREILDRVGVTKRQDAPQTNIQNNIVVLPNQVLGKYGTNNSTGGDSQQ